MFNNPINISSTNQISLDSLVVDRFSSWVKEEDEGAKVHIKLPNGQNRVFSKEFIEWFRGFVDAEGCFMVPKRKQGFGFRMDIVLHVDDKDVLNYIIKILGIGNVYILKSSSTALFSVISRAELLFIICIFSKYNLNTTKHRPGSA